VGKRKGGVSSSLDVLDEELHIHPYDIGDSWTAPLESPGLLPPPNSIVIIFRHPSHQDTFVHQKKPCVL
jgi:hypothetical protein